MLLALILGSSFLGIYYYRNTIYRLLLRVLLFILKFYVYMLNLMSSVLPTFIFIKMQIHRSMDTDFTVHEYYYNFNGRFHKFKLIESKDYDINDYFDSINVEKLYDINHVCILNKNGEYTMDITKDIRHFIHLRKIIEWKYILIHLGIEDEELVVVHRNDEELSESVLHIKSIYNEKFDF